MRLSIHRAEKIKTQVRYLGKGEVPFAVLDLTDDRDGRSTLFFDSLDSIIAFTTKIVEETRRVQREAQEEGP